MMRQTQRRFRNRGYSVCGQQTFAAKGFSGLPSSPQPMELRFLTKPPSETWAHPLNALPSRKGASTCSGKGFLGHQGLLAPQTRPESLWHWGGGGREGHVPVPPRLASFSSQLRWLCLLIQHPWAWRCGQSLSHGPWERGAPKVLEKKARSSSVAILVALPSCLLFTR